MTRGCLITLEGGEGAGKSTQGRLLSARLSALGHAVTVTREPGGSAGAEAIRGVLLDPTLDGFDAMTQALLFAAARRDHIRARIAPALAAGGVVISDRFYDSTRAYQGARGGISAARIRLLERMAVGRLKPDLTLMLDLPVAEGLRRAALRHGQALSSSDTFERRSHGFHEAVRQRFLAIAADEPERCAVIDASGDAETVFAALMAVVDQRLPRLMTPRGPA